MPIITLTTDFALKDYYVGLLKGALLSKGPALQIVDISNNVAIYDIVQGAFILKNCFAEFPVGTIHDY
jgi:S-adenosylmethionine hydrolase